jgi:hypothetical protein
MRINLEFQTFKNIKIKWSSMLGKQNKASLSEAPPAELEASGSPLKGGEYVGKAPLRLN